MARSSGLGRGLGELIQRTDAPAVEEVAAFKEIEIAQISANPKQPRQVFDEDELAELVDSIAEVGLLQPIVVRPVGDGYELIMGERRLRAAGLAGMKQIPAIIRDTEDEDLLRDALLENLHRVDLNPLEEAAAYQQLLDDFGCTQEELSQRIKRSRPQISNTMRLLKLPPQVQNKVAAGVLSAGHARALLALPSAMEQISLADRIIAEGLSVRSTEEIVALGETTRTVTRSKRMPSEREMVLSERLSDYFDTRVKVNVGKSKGKIVIEFAGDDDLDRIMSLFNDK